MNNYDCFGSHSQLGYYNDYKMIMMQCSVTMIKWILAVDTLSMKLFHRVKSSRMESILFN
jgi:hypothetical protein